MARQSKKAAAGKAATDPDAPRRSIERLITRGQAKEAYKEAKAYYLKDPRPENRTLIERTYLLRIQEMLRGGMISTAREVALNYLEFGSQDLGSASELVVLLPKLGLAGKALELQAKFPSPELSARLQAVLADRSVVRPDDIPDSLSDLRKAAEPVRQALTAIDGGNYTQALELLQPVPRSSLLADWRLFVRGLVAFRQNDLDQAKANWDRLDPMRAARSITTTLLALSDPHPGGPPDRFKALEASAFGEPVLSRLAEVRKALDQGLLFRVLQLSGPLRAALRRIDVRFAQRLTELIQPALGTEIMHRPLHEAQQLLRDFKAALEPLPWDPNWHRFEALLWEGPQVNPGDSVHFWQKYLKDLDQGATAPFGELHQVKALVWRRIGVIHADLADDDDLPSPGRQKKKKNKAGETHRTKAAEAFNQSLRLDPAQRKTHQRVIDLHSESGPDKLIEALEQLLRAFPHDVEGLQELVKERRLRDEPEHVLALVERLRPLRPLDERLNADEVWARLARARHLALKGHWDEGRAEFARLEGPLQKHVLDIRLFTRRAVFELKAGDPVRADEFLTQAKAIGKEPTAVWLLMAIEAARYELPKDLIERFNRDFEATLAKKASSETARLLAETIIGYRISKLDYPGHDRHLQHVLKYLRRTTRLKYLETDLLRVCEMLQVVHEEKLLTSLLKRGVTLFPHSPAFLVMDVQQNIQKGPFTFNQRDTLKKLEKALALAQESQNPGKDAQVRDIREMILKVQDLGRAMSPFPFGGAPFGGSPFGGNPFAGFEDDQDLGPMFEFDFGPPPKPPKRPPKRKPK